MLGYFETFTSCQRSKRTFSKHYSKCKTVSIKFRKTIQERRLRLLKFPQDNPQNNFLNFLTSKNIFITLQYSGDILEYSRNIISWLLEFVKNQHLLLSNHTLLTQKQLFHQELFKKSLPLKYSLNVSWISRTLQRWGNTQRIFPEYCVPPS